MASMALQRFQFIQFIRCTNNTTDTYKENQKIKSSSSKQLLVNIQIHHNKCKYQKGSPKVWVNTNMAPIILHSTLHSVIKATTTAKYCGVENGCRFDFSFWGSLQEHILGHAFTASWSFDKRGLSPRKDCDSPRLSKLQDTVKA